MNQLNNKQHTPHANKKYTLILVPVAPNVTTSSLFLVVSDGVN